MAEAGGEDFKNMRRLKLGGEDFARFGSSSSVLAPHLEVDVNSVVAVLPPHLEVDFGGMWISARGR